jgi:hypothetical protein
MFNAVERAGYLGASDMPFVMNDKSPEDLLHWWEVKVGIREQDPQTYAMRLGSLVGEFILDEYQRIVGEPITARQLVVPSQVNKRLKATLDGFMPSRQAVVEAKFASPFFDREMIFSTYYPQVALQMHCMDAEAGFLVVAQGTNEPIEIECIRDAAYEKQLLDRCAAMLECMDSMTPPVTIESPSIVPPERWRTIDLSVDAPNWADELVCLLLVYENTRAAADQHDEAGDLIRGLVPDDVGKVRSDGHTISRNKKGTLTIRRRAA